MGIDMDLKPHIRWMIRRDMPEVLAIEAENFDEPWQEDDFIRCLRQRNCIGMVAEVDESVAGFDIYELHSDHLFLLNFAVDSKFKRKGVGKAMVAKLKNKLNSQRRKCIQAVVRETNVQAQLFFSSMDFRAVSTLRDYYDLENGEIEDGYLFDFKHCESENIYVPSNRIGAYYEVSE